MKHGKKGEKLLTLDRVCRPRVSEMSNNQSASAASASQKSNPEFTDQIRQA